jgi:Integrase core domain
LCRAFNSRVRDECLSINIFWSLAHARIVIGDWKQEYNHHRPHSALGYQPPARYAASCHHLSPSKLWYRVLPGRLLPGGRFWRGKTAERSVCN